jgi:hypothetical protein
MAERKPNPPPPPSLPPRDELLPLRLEIVSIIELENPHVVPFLYSSQARIHVRFKSPS